MLSDPYFIFGQVIGLFGMAANTLAVQLKQKKQILLAFIAGAFLWAASMAVLGAWAGAVSCVISGVLTIINYFFEKKERPLPTWLLGVFIALVSGAGMMTYGQIYDVLPVVGSVAYILSIAQKKESRIRKIMIVNTAAWVIYNIMVAAYVGLFSNVVFLISTVTAMIRLDFKKEKGIEGDGNILT